MLNDILSLIVALYAIKLSGQQVEDADTKYSYGWHRAEILAALINGVFLLALCFSIFMEAIERFFSSPEISNPKLVVIVGSLGLASNFIGLFLFHEHSHSHHDHGHGHSHSKESRQPITEQIGVHVETPTSGSVTPTAENERGRSRSRSRSHSRSDSLYGHPAATRAYVVQQAQELQRARSPSPSTTKRGHRQSFSCHLAEGGSNAPVTESSPLLGGKKKDTSRPSSPVLTDQSASSTVQLTDTNTTKRISAHSHSGSMNMHALLLHVLGDALGNVGVIATGLIIWLSDLSWKYYFDPIISLVITCIIFSSALPLVKSASFILLQGVPSGISLQEVDEAIRDVDGVEDVHELHIWQLSESKLVASVHVLASRKRDFMQVAVDIRKALHDRGIHSSTIQPEYHPVRQSTSGSSSIPMPTNGFSCLVTCPPNQWDCNPVENACCPPPTSSV